MDFFAKLVKCYVEDDVAYMTFADSLGNEPDQYVILSKTQFVEDDENFGVYLITSEGLEGYDLICKVKITENVLYLFLANAQKITATFDLSWIDEVKKYVTLLFNQHL